MSVCRRWPAAGLDGGCGDALKRWAVKGATVLVGSAVVALMLAMAAVGVVGAVLYALAALIDALLHAVQDWIDERFAQGVGGLW